jgi:hypothetical protein
MQDKLEEEFVVLNINYIETNILVKLTKIVYTANLADVSVVAERLAKSG